MNAMRRPGLWLLASIAWMPVVHCAEPVNVAIIATPSAQDLAASLTVQLSSEPTLHLLERQEMAAVGDEVKLQQMAGDDAAALGRLLHADGLLFLDQRADGLHIRLTAVNLGYALLDETVPPGIDPPQEAKIIAHLLENNASKLTLDAVHAVPISVLNLRADEVTADALKFERNLTLLVEGELAAVPEYVVLERRHALDLGFERSLDRQPSPLLEGAFVIDGTLSQPTPGEIEVHLRLRPPHGEPIESTIPGSALDLPGLARRLVTEIRKATGSSSPVEWRPENEAHEYLLEGIWAWQHKVTESALEALDSAELLGEKAPQLFAIRSEVLCATAGADLHIENGHIILPDSPSSQSADQRATTIIRAIQDAVQFSALKSPPQPSADPAVRRVMPWIDPDPLVIPLATNILVLLDRDAPEQANAVRIALRDLTRFDPENGALGPFHSMGDATMRDLFLEEWPATLEEQLAAYRLACGNSSDWIPTVMLRDSVGFCPRFLKTPVDQRQQFDAVVQTLQGQPSRQTRYLLIRSSSRDPAQADAAFQAYLAQLWLQRDAFIKTRNYLPDWACSRELPDDVRLRNAKAGLPLLHYVLANRDRLDGYDIPLTLLWQPAGWSHEEAAAVWKEYLAYKVRVGVETPDDFFQTFERPFALQFPDLAVTAPLPPPPSSAALVVTKFWYPWRYTAAPAGYYYGGIAAVQGRYVWDTIEQQAKKMLVRIDLDDFSCTNFADPTPEGSNAFSFCATPDALYAAGETRGHDGSGNPLAHEIARLDSSTGTWETHAIPDCFNAQLYGAGSELYFFLSSSAGGNEDVIDRYDWDRNATTILASTRRRPAQNQFDDRNSLGSVQIYEGPGGRPCLSTFDGTFYVQDTPGPWPAVFDGLSGASVTRAGSDTLVVSGKDEVVLLDPQVAEPMPLLGPIEAGMEKPAAPENPVQSFPPSKARAPWDAPGGGRFYYTNVAYHQDSLYILREPTVQGGDYTLLCYQRGKGRQARPIALRFQLDDRARADLAAKPAGAPALWMPTEIEHPDTIRFPGPGVHLVCTETGICLVPMELGFWYLPFADLDAFLKNYGGNPPASGPDKVTAKVTSTQPSAGDNNSDVGDPTSFR